MNRLKNNYYGHVCAVILSTVLISSANAVELEDESQNSIFHEVKGNLSFDKFGTSLGLYNGRHSTTIPVVSVPGNTELEVAVYLQQYPESKYTTPQPFAVPMITGVLPCGYDEPVWRDYLEDLIDSDFTTGVSSPGSPAPHAGMWLHIPGMSAERLGNKGNNNVSASTLNNYYYECTDNYPGQGNYPGDAPDFSMTIEVHAPNGHKYVFDQMAFDYGPDAVEFGEGILYASYVEDPFGNRVSFNQEDGIVSSISASDGRRITFNYSGDHKSDSATVTMSTNGRDWVWQGRWGEKPKIVGNSYEWGAQRSLTLPDNTTWTFDATDQTGIEATSACNDQSGELVIKNPTGAKLTLTLDNIVVFAAYRSGSVTKLPPKNQYNCKDFWKLTYANQLRRKSEHGAVKQATIAAPGVSTDYVWNIEYEEGWGRTVSVNPSFALERTVSKPDGSSLRYQFESHSAASFITNIISTEVLDKNNNILASYYPEYMFSRRVLTIHGDDTGAASGGRAQKEHQTLLSSAVTKIGSDVFTTTYKYSETNNLDKYNIPSQITRSSVHGGTARAVDFTYRNLSLDSEGIYRVGLLATEKRNNKLFVTNTYTDYGSLETAKSFNSSAATSHVYYTSGLLKKTISPIGRVDEYSQYKRGIPKTTIKAKGTGDQITLIREVDNNGWVTSETDAMGFSVSIEHDDLGRVDKVSYPGRNRAAENIIYSNLGSGLKEKITVGNSETTTTYDGLSRPTLIQRRDLSGIASTEYERFEYDAFGRTTFASWPSHSSAPTRGIDTSYDALGRVEIIAENVTPYAQTSFEYLSGDRVKSTDPQGHEVTTTYAGYYPLSTVAPIKYEHPLGIKTTIKRNIWGQPSSVVQSGSWNGSPISQTQNYFYNDKLELCGHYAIETNHSRYAYDDAGRLKTYQASAGSSGDSCPAPTGTNLVTLNYDNLGRLKLTNYADSDTPDINRTYDLNGNLKTAVRGGIDWAYYYDNLNQLTDEILTVDSRTYQIEYGHNNYGFVTEKTLPTGKLINFTHDGFGRIRSVKSNGQTYAQGMTYHANNIIDDMTYGNDQVLSQTLNARQMPEYIYSAKGSMVALDLKYQYDSRGDVTDIIDGVDSNNTKSLDYDDLGRLISANGPWGTGSFVYDALGNIRWKYLGNRSVQITYDTFNRVKYSRDSTDGTRSFTHDSFGNVKKAGNLNFVYDKEQQPIQVTGAVSGSYSYDGNLKRVKSEVDGNTIYSIYDITGKLIHVDNRSGGELTVCLTACSDFTFSKVTDYVHGNSMTIARLSNDKPTFLHNDLLGSPQSGSDSSGTVVWTESYTPYGEKWEKTPRSNDLGGFTGHVSDSATGLTYMQARYYDPVIGRFYSNDPVDVLGHMTRGNSIANGFNRYAYANNNPYKYTDPDGEFSIVHAVAFAVGAGINAYSTYKSTGDIGKTIKSGFIGGASAALSVSPAGLVRQMTKSFFVGAGADATSQVFVDGKDIADIDAVQSLKSGAVSAASTGLGYGASKLTPVDNMPAVREPNVPAGRTQRMTEHPGTAAADKTKQGVVGATAGGVAGGTQAVTEERLREQ